MAGVSSWVFVNDELSTELNKVKQKKAKKAKLISNANQTWFIQSSWDMAKWKVQKKRKKKMPKSKSRKTKHLDYLLFCICCRQNHRRARPAVARPGRRPIESICRRRRRTCLRCRNSWRPLRTCRNRDQDSKVNSPCCGRRFRRYWFCRSILLIERKHVECRRKNVTTS